MTKNDEREPLATKDANTPASRIPTSASKLKPPSTFKKPLTDMKPPPMPDLGKKRPGTAAAAPASKRPRLDRSTSGSGRVSVDDSFTGRLPSKPTSGALSGRPSTIATRAISGRSTNQSSAVSTRASTTRASLYKSNSGSSLTRNTSGSSLNNRSVTSGAATRSAAKPAAKSTVPSAGEAPARAKRPAWDLKGRVQDLEKLIFDKSYKLKENTEQLSQVSVKNEELESNLAHQSKLKTNLEEKVRDLEKSLRETEEDFQRTRRKLERDLEDLNEDKSRLERQRDGLDGELKASLTRVAGLETTVAQMTSAQAGIQAQYEASKIQLESSQEFGRQKEQEIEELKRLLAEKEELADQLNAKCRAHETERRKLHNTIQELKGNIRVFCRVRPFIPSEMTSQNVDDVPYHVHFPDVDCKQIELDNLAATKLNDTKTAHHVFKFDHVFKPSSSQMEVFEEISQLVQSALDGYNVCIFAYGQTGSGKTYTMEGPDRPDEDSEGMIPRAVRQIFLSAQQLEEGGWKYEMEASFIEIYNETIRDLLGSGDTKIKHDIKMVNAKTNELAVTNLQLVNVTSAQQVAGLLRKASENRAVAETKMNERSSRSHSVFILKLRGHNTITEETCDGTLNLVDLAGSERLKESGSQGARLKETQAINSSLSNLGNVIMALANKEPHIPYRNSKLTYLLQNSLGGNSKTLMFVNVSPREEHLSETVNSLRFAAKVNNCNIGTAQRKTK